MQQPELEIEESPKHETLQPVSVKHTEQMESVKSIQKVESEAVIESEVKEEEVVVPQ